MYLSTPPPSARTRCAAGKENTCARGDGDRCAVAATARPARPRPSAARGWWDHQRVRGSAHHRRCRDRDRRAGHRRDPRPLPGLRQLQPLICRRTWSSQTGTMLAEYAVVLPALLLLVFGLFQFAAWYLASEVALGAAQDAARAARIQTGSVPAGQAAARRFLDQANGGMLVNPQITVTRDPDKVRVDVRGFAQSVVPGLVLPVHEAAAGEVERFRGEQLGFGTADGRSRRDQRGGLK